MSDWMSDAVKKIRDEIVEVEQYASEVCNEAHSCIVNVDTRYMSRILDRLEAAEAQAEDAMKQYNDVACRVVPECGRLRAHYDSLILKPLQPVAAFQCLPQGCQRRCQALARSAQDARQPAR